MYASVRQAKATCRVPRIALLALAMPTLLAACQREAESAAPEIRAVRTITVEKRQPGVPITITGRIEALDEAALGFRISGRILENDLKLGEQVKTGQVLARLESQNELNALRSAQANLAAAENWSARAIISNARNFFWRGTSSHVRRSMKQNRCSRLPSRTSMLLRRN
jgi:multidrug efflux pump subunit AcrA (membrane-fusion protein)